MKRPRHLALRSAYDLGLADARRAPANWSVLVALIVAGVVASSVGVVISGAPLVAGPMVDAVVPDGPWAFEWGRSAVAPSEEQQDRVRALRPVVAGAAVLVAVLSLLTVGAAGAGRGTGRRDRATVQGPHRCLR